MPNTKNVEKANPVKEMNNWEKLLDLQTRLLKLGYTGKAGKEGTKFEWKYVTIQKLKMSLQPLFVEYGWVLIQPLEAEGDDIYVHTQIIDVKNGKVFLENRLPLKVANPADPKSWGAASTYGRRYAILCLLNLVGDKDDDCYMSEEEILRSISEISTVADLIRFYKSIEEERKPAFKERFAKRKAEIEAKEEVNEAIIVLEESK